MRNICYYISDHGLGHTTRSSAVVKIVLEKCEDVNFYIKCSSGYGLLKRTFNKNKNVTVIKCRNDVGVKDLPRSLLMDTKITKASVKRWFSRWYDYIKKEKKFMLNKKIDTVVVDIPPQPLIAAEEIGIKGVVASNFNWLDIYKPLFGKDDEMKNILEGIKVAYSTATALKFRFTFNNFVYKKSYDVGLVRRTADKNAGIGFLKRNKMPLKNNVFLTGGFFAEINNSTAERIAANSNLYFILSSNIRVPNRFRQRYLRISNPHIEAQNLIANSSAVVGKSGYSTVSEAIGSDVPLFLIVRPHFAEDKIIVNEISKLGVGKEITEETLNDVEFFDTLLEEAGRMRKNYSKLHREFKSIDYERIISELTG